MKDNTKHIIAKEIFFFFRWLTIGFVISIPFWVVGFFDIGPYWTAEFCGYAVIALLSLPILLYIYRFVKWLVLWVKKWK